MTAHLSNTTKNLIVYVDDDPDDLLFVREAMLSSHQSLEVVTFESPSKAYEFFLHLERVGEKPCLIILDINMPGISGKELVPALRNISHFENTPLILFTTSNSAEDAGFARAHNVGFITKPMNFGQMHEVAARFLSHCSEEVKRSLL